MAARIRRTQLNEQFTFGLVAFRLGIVLGAMVLRSAAMAQEYQWTFTDIDGLSGTSSAPEIVFVPDGTMHVAYFSKTALEYAVRSPAGSWSGSTLVSNATPGRRLSLAVDAEGNPRIAWETQWSPNNPPVRYIEYVSGSWSAVMTVGNGEEPCISLDSTGIVHLVYSNYYTATPYKTHVPGTGTWQDGPALPLSFSWWPTIAINPLTDEPVVVCNPGDALYFELSGGSWSSCFITSDPGPGYGLDPHALALDSATSEPHVVWQDAVHNIKYGRRTSLPCTWQIESLGATGFAQAIVRNSAGDVFVLYCSDAGLGLYDLKLARRDFVSGLWTHSVVAPGGVDTSIPQAEMLLDFRGDPAIVFSMRLGSEWKPVLAEVTQARCYEFGWVMGNPGTGPGQFAADLSPRGMIVVGDYLYVCDYGNNRIQWFRTRDGAYAGHKNLGTYPTDIIYDAGRHHFYVRTYSSVIAYDESFTELCRTSIPTQSWVHYGLSQDSQGNIHTPSSYYPYIYIVSPDCPMQITGQYAAPSQQTAGVEAAGGFVYAACGNLGIRKYTEDGTDAGTVVPGDEGPAFLCRLGGARMAAFLAGPQQIAIYDRDWVEVCRFGGLGTGEAQFTGGQGIAADGCGNLYVSDGSLHRVQKFTPAATWIGDMNCDGVVGFDDINPFILALSNWGVYLQTYPNCDIYHADINGDGFVNFRDINPFVTLLSGQCPAAP